MPAVARPHATERADWTPTAFNSRCNLQRCCGVVRQGVWCLKPPHPPCRSRPCNPRCQRAATSSAISYAHVPQRVACRPALQAQLHGHLCTPAAAAAAALELDALEIAVSALPGAAWQLLQVCFGCWLEGNATSDRRRALATVMSVPPAISSMVTQIDVARNRLCAHKARREHECL